MPVPDPTSTATLSTGEATHWIPAGDHAIPGVLVLPEAAPAASAPLAGMPVSAHAPAPTPVPVVLMLHGAWSQKNEVGDMFRDTAAALAAAGIASLRIDFAGSGDSTQSTLELTIDAIFADALTAFDWLASGASGTAFSTVSGIGFSRGSRAMSHVVAHRASLFAAVVWNGEIMDYENLPIPSQAVAEGHLVVDLGFRLWDTSLAYFESAASCHSLSDYATFAGPVLLVSGDADTVVLPAHLVAFQAALAAAGNTDVTRLDIAGADHVYEVFTDNQAPSREVIAGTVAWLAERLLP